LNLSGRTISNIDTADNADIRRAITKATPKARIQARRFAKKFDRGTELQTCKAIFDFLKNDLNYVADGDHQVVQLPSALLRNRRGDCKSYSVFTSAVLSNLGIPHYYVYASYTGNPTPGHIYVVTDSGIIIDAVYGHFNKEKAANYKYPTNINGTMRVSTIAGVAKCCASCEPQGIGFFLKGKKPKGDKPPKGPKRKDVCGKQGAKVVTLSPGRVIFLLAVKNNMDGFATKMSKMDNARLTTLWCNVGGKPEELFEAIRKGASKKSRKLGILSKLADRAGVKIGSTFIGATLTQPQIDAITNGIPAVAIAAGTAIGLAVGQPAKGAAAGTSLATVMKGLTPIIIQAIQAATPADVTDDIEAPTDVEKENIPDGDAAAGGSGGGNAAAGGSGGGAMNTTNLLLIAGGLVTAYFIFKK